MIAGRPAEVSREAVAAAVDPAGDRAVSRAVDLVASPGVSPTDGLAVNPVVGPVIGTIVVRRNAPPVVGPVVNQAVSQVDSEPISRAAKAAPLAVAGLVRGVHPMSVRNVRLGRWVRLSPKKSTSPNSIQLF